MNELKEQVNQIFTKYELHSSAGAVCKNNAKDDLMQLIETYTTEKCLEVLEQVSFDMYDINDLEWGIPTKWSVKDENDNHADLWIPQGSAVEKIQYRITQLSTQLSNQKKEQ